MSYSEFSYYSEPSTTSSGSKSDHTSSRGKSSRNIGNNTNIGNIGNLSAPSTPSAPSVVDITNIGNFSSCGYKQFHSRPMDTYRCLGISWYDSPFICDLPYPTCETHEDINVFRCFYCSRWCKLALPVEGSSICCYVKHNYDGPGCCIYSKHFEVKTNLNPCEDLVGTDCGLDMRIEGCFQLFSLPFPTPVGLRWCECFIPCCPYFTCIRQCSKKADCCCDNGLMSERDNHFPPDVLNASRTETITCPDICCIK